MVEDNADHVLGAFKTQKEAIDWAKKNGHSPLVARTAFQRQENPRPLARGLLVGGTRLLTASPAIRCFSPTAPRFRGTVLC
jgi:hypothetical protein